MNKNIQLKIDESKRLRSEMKLRMSQQRNLMHEEISQFKTPEKVVKRPTNSAYEARRPE